MLQDLYSVFQNLLNRVLQVFPKSPFTGIVFTFQNSEFLGYLNWFFPVSEVLIVMQAWLIAIGVFYLWSVVARWVKLIGS